MCGYFVQDEINGRVNVDKTRVKRQSQVIRVFTEIKNEM